MNESDELRGQPDAVELSRVARALDVSDAPAPRREFVVALAARLEREAAAAPRRRRLAFPRVGLAWAASVAAAVVLAIGAATLFPPAPGASIGVAQRILLASANGFVAYDPATLQERERVNVAALDPWAVLAPDQRTLVFTFRQYGRVMRVLDIRDPSAFRTVEGVDDPFQLVLSRDGARAYVRDGASIKIVDVAAARAVGTIPTPGIEDSPLYLAPDDRRLFQFRPDRELVVFDVAARAELRRVPVDLADLRGTSASARIVFSPDGRYLYAVGSALSPSGPVRLLVLDAATLATVADRTIDPEGGPSLGRGETPFASLDRALASLGFVADAKELGSVTQIALSPDGRTLYAARGGVGEGILVIDTQKLELVGRLRATRNVYAIQLSPDGSRVYALAAPSGPLGSAELLAVDSRSYGVVATASTRGTPADSAILLYKP